LGGRIEAFRIEHRALIVIAEQHDLAMLHDQVDALARVGAVADHVAQTVNVLYALIFNVLQDCLQRLQVTVDVADNGFHAGFLDSWLPLQSTAELTESKQLYHFIRRFSPLSRLLSVLLKSKAHDTASCYCLANGQAVPNAFFCAAVIFSTPCCPKCSNRSSCALVKVASSPVPCTSMNCPLPVMTRFKST